MDESLIMFSRLYHDELSLSLSLSCFNYSMFYFCSIYIQCFTMDEKRSKAVIEAFVRLYKAGLIYR